MNILFVGDIFGRPGRTALRKVLPELQKEFDVDLTVVNIENASSGNGVTPENYQDLKSLGVDCFTSGNHIFTKKEIIPVLENQAETIIRPANFPPGSPGRGVWTSEIGTTKVAVVNLLGRVFMHEGIDDPFRAVDELIKPLANHLIIIDMHAEATSEKRALGFYLDGRVGAVLGTHTHIPTADAQLLPQGTAYITDVGFCGPWQSVLGVDKDVIIHNFTHEPRLPHEVGSGDVELNAVLMQSAGHKITTIQAIRRIVEL